MSETKDWPPRWSRAGGDMFSRVANRLTCAAVDDDQCSYHVAASANREARQWLNAEADLAALTVARLVAEKGKLAEDRDYWKRQYMDLFEDAFHDREELRKLTEDRDHWKREFQDQYDARVKDAEQRDLARAEHMKERERAQEEAEATLRELRAANADLQAELRALKERAAAEPTKPAKKKLEDGLEYRWAVRYVAGKPGVKYHLRCSGVRIAIGWTQDFRTLFATKLEAKKALKQRDSVMTRESREPAVFVRIRVKGEK